MPNQYQRTFIDALTAACNNPAAKAANLHDGPIPPIFSINFSNLPACVHKSTTDLIVEINNSQAPYDKSLNLHASRTDNTIGAMRQVHSNDPRYLPAMKFDSLKLAGRSKIYNAYVLSNKGHTNDRREESSTTGYVEYTAGNQEIYPHAYLSNARIVFDYVNGLMYYAPFHYQGWTPATV